MTRERVREGNAIIAPSHTRFVVAVHLVVSVNPRSHAVQAMQVEAAVPVWYLPGSHATHSVSWWLSLFWYVPVDVETQVVKAKRNHGWHFTRASAVRSHCTPGAACVAPHSLLLTS